MSIDNNRTSDVKTSGDRYFEVHRRLDICPDPLQVYETLFGSSRNGFLLESSVVRDGFSRFSFVGNASAPGSEVIRYNLERRVAHIEDESGARSVSVPDFFHFMEERLASRSVRSVEALPFDFNGGYVGYLGYELKAQAVGTTSFASDEPAAVQMFSSRLVVIDHQDECAYNRTNSE